MQTHGNQLPIDFDDERGREHEETVAYLKSYYDEDVDLNHIYRYNEVRKRIH